MVQTIFYLDLSLLLVLLIKTDQCFLNGQYSSNQINRDSNFLNFKDFEREKKKHELLMKT